MSHAPRTFIALGSNLPYRGVAGAALLAQAVAALKQAGLAPRALSGIWETAAQPPSDQPAYFNACAELDCGTDTPQQLYAALRAIEVRFGRERRERWGARTLDLDILAMGAEAGTFDEITLPHPRLQDRAFVLFPLAEIAPEWRHPRLGKTVADLLRELPPGQPAVRIGAFSGSP
ncbi:2-amino-4-hydroxy-6-hydroxymethyldihydropteridine diphosphokinase [Terricaulis sp.]|uniref:2-amino-4-hydroxy-6- hydroxymethyldihydropteridine diphosphokinase n=1 Tax=Terricaulis sp. TaxID=2768686 RepID=UPI0037830D5D